MRDKWRAGRRFLREKVPEAMEPVVYCAYKRACAVFCAGERERRQAAGSLRCSGVKRMRGESG